MAVTDLADADRVRSAGGEPRVVARSERELDAIAAILDRAARAARAARGGPRSVIGWHVDAASNSVVVLADPTDLTGAAGFVATSGADPAAVRVVPSTHRPRLLYDVRGGDGYVISGVGSCSMGFSVNGGFVTVGHCGPAGASTTGTNGVPLGTVQGSTFPGADHAWVAVNASWLPRPWVRDARAADGNVAVTGSAVAAVGSAVCRSGFATGWRCGTIQAMNVTVSTSGGLVSGLTRTNACADHSDSGGPFVTGQEAQGVTVAGSGNCTTPTSTTYVQPVNPILAAYGLTLLPPTASPTITWYSCEQGVRKIVCETDIVGGTPPVTLRWYWNGNHVPSWDNRYTIAGGCQPFAFFTVEAVVTGANGVSDSRGRVVRCVNVIP